MEDKGKNEKKNTLRGDSYIAAGSYAEYLWGRIKNGGVIEFGIRIYKKIRQYTLFTTVLRGVVTVIMLLEKSALLLLIFSALLILLPFALIPMTVCAVISVVRYFRMHGAVKPWITDAERVTVYVTAEGFFDTEEAQISGGKNGKNESVRGKLFARCAVAEAGEYDHPVIVVCSDRFLTAKWVGLNLLLVKCDYFFILRRFYLKNTSTVYVVLS